jgi:hypothetical protein
MGRRKPDRFRNERRMVGRHEMGAPCESTGKRIFRSEAAAAREIERAQRDHDLLGQTQRQECRWYRCASCFFYHLTSLALPNQEITA